MKLSDIRPARGAVKKRKRIGCGTGSGHGKTATRGMKGQKSRSGGGTPPWFEGGQMPLQRRVPKRGFTNIFKIPYQVVNIERLNRFEKGTKVDRDALLEAGLIRKASIPVKILGRGELSVALEIEIDAVSASAAKAIEDAGGTIRLPDASAVRSADKESTPVEKAPEPEKEPPVEEAAPEPEKEAPSEETPPPAPKAQEEKPPAEAQPADDTPPASTQDEPPASGGECADASVEERQ